MDVPHGTGVVQRQLPDPAPTTVSGIPPSATGDESRNSSRPWETVAERLGRDYPARSEIGFVVALVNTMVSDLQPILIIVLSATGAAPLACVNVTSLLLARAAGRGEMAVRSALGARRGHGAATAHRSVVPRRPAPWQGAAAYLGVQVLLACGASRLPRLEAVPFDVSVLLLRAAC